jgi:hypothetical protein
MVVVVVVVVVMVVVMAGGDPPWGSVPVRGLVPLFTQTSSFLQWERL